jgi:hypothetical protein
MKGNHRKIGDTKTHDKMLISVTMKMIHSAVSESNHFLKDRHHLHLVKVAGALVEFHPHLQQIETEKFGQNLRCPLRIQEIHYHHVTQNLIRKHFNNKTTNRILRSPSQSGINLDRDPQFSPEPPTIPEDSRTLSWTRISSPTSAD